MSPSAPAPGLLQRRGGGRLTPEMPGDFFVKKLKPILLVLLALVVVLFGARNFLIKREVRRLVAQQTGFGISLHKVDVGLFSASVNIEGLELTNPPDFPEEAAFEVRQVKANYALGSIFRNEIRLTEVVVDVPRVVVVRKADGETNLQRLSGAGKKKGDAGDRSGPGGGKPAPSESKPAKPLRMDRVVIRLGTVEIHDYTAKGEKPGITKLDLNIDQEHENVNGVGELGSLMVGGVLQQVGSKFMRDLGRALNEGDGADGEVKKVTKSLEKAFKSLFEGGGK